eukprot:scaffold220050_cov55-Attheya_sp.AAC.2
MDSPPRSPRSPPPAAFELTNQGDDTGVTQSPPSSTLYSGDDILENIDVLTGLDNPEDDDDYKLSTSERKWYSRFLYGSCICIWVLFIVAIVVGTKGKQDREKYPISDGEPVVELIKSSKGYPIYSCPDPSLRNRAENDVGSTFARYHEDGKRLSEKWYSQIETGGTVSFVNTLYDGNNEDYETIKEVLTSWKIKYFCPYLRSGHSIYESAMGSGMNLLLTIQILDFHCGIKDLFVAGNDYVQNNVKNAIYLHSVLEPKLSQDSYFCVADSASSGTDHNHNPYSISGHVPASSFDVVFTGYLEPFADPLGIFENIFNAHKKNEALVELLCEGGINENQNVVAAAAVAAKYQEAQEEWFAKWVHELIRIAKNGAPILIESIPLPLCSHSINHVSGVPKSFWEQGVNTYGWDIDEETIEFYDMQFFGDFRYNVFMKKNTIYDDDSIEFG